MHLKRLANDRASLHALPVAAATFAVFAVTVADIGVDSPKGGTLSLSPSKSLSANGGNGSGGGRFSFH